MSSKPGALVASSKKGSVLHVGNRIAVGSTVASTSNPDDLPSGMDALVPELGWQKTRGASLPCFEATIPDPSYLVKFCEWGILAISGKLTEPFYFPPENDPLCVAARNFERVAKIIKKKAEPVANGAWLFDQAGVFEHDADSGVLGTLLLLAGFPKAAIFCGCRILVERYDDENPCLGISGPHYQVWNAAHYIDVDDEPVPPDREVPLRGELRKQLQAPFPVSELAAAGDGVHHFDPHHFVCTQTVWENQVEPGLRERLGTPMAG